MDNEQKIISVLRDTSQRSKLAASVFYLFALRERARSRITLRSLMLRMKAEGFTFSKTEYQEFFNLLADLKIGQIERTNRGTIKGLRDIAFTLQSVGRASVGKAEHLVSFKPRGNPKLSKPQTLFRPGLTIRNPLSKDVLVKLMVTIDNKPWVLEVPKDYTEQDVAKIICMLNRN